MFLQPKKTLFRKYKKGYIKKTASSKVNSLQFGDYGIKVLSSFRITARQLESLRQCLNRELKREGKLWFRVFPQIPVTKQPTENRMGKGKGGVDFWMSPLKPGTILVELGGSVSESKSIRALTKACAKLPVNSVIVRRFNPF